MLSLNFTSLAWPYILTIVCLCVFSCVSFDYGNVGRSGLICRSIYCQCLFPLMLLWCFGIILWSITEALFSVILVSLVIRGMLLFSLVSQQNFSHVHLLIFCCHLCLRPPFFVCSIHFCYVWFQFLYEVLYVCELTFQHHRNIFSMWKFFISLSLERRCVLMANI